MISDLRARLEKTSIGSNTLTSPENVSAAPEINSSSTEEEANQRIPEDLQLWVQEAKVTAHSKGAVEDLEPTAVNAVEGSDGDESEDESRTPEEIENGSSALSPSVATDGGHSSTTKSPVVGGNFHPIGLIAQNAVRIANDDQEPSAGNDKQGVGIAHPGYFRPG